MKNNRFIIISCGYNCHKYYFKCIESVLKQTYTNYTHIIIDDASNPPLDIPDELTKVVKYYNDSNIKWIPSVINKLDNHISSEEDICVILDLDDWLAGPKVLETLNNVYQDPKIWMTYSQFQYYPTTKTSRWIGEYPKYIMQAKAFRQAMWCFTHLRTFKAFLWKNVNKDDLKDYTGNYTKYTYDQALLFPMLEMSGIEHIHYIPEVQYIYNTENPLQVERINKQEQERLSQYFRSKSIYPYLKRV